MQTWFVHMRKPARLWRELGPSGFFGFQIVVGGTVLSALAHPWFYVLAGYDLGGATFWLVAGSTSSPVISPPWPLDGLRRGGGVTAICSLRCC